MKNKLENLSKNLMRKNNLWIVFLFLIVILFIFGGDLFGLGKVSYGEDREIVKVIKQVLLPEEPKYKPLNKEDYDLRMEKLANNPVPAPAIVVEGASPDTAAAPAPVPKPSLWPVKNLPYPKDGAILPFKRVIAYYGNLYSKRMGVLGEYPEAEMFAKLDAEVKKWEVADPETPVQPALHYIVTTAQLAPGEDGKYRLRMPEKEIDKVLVMAEKINAIVFLDIQVGFSTVQSEIPVLEKYLKMPQVHLGLDPEFSMKSGIRPGKVVGTMDATDINFATEYLAKLVQENDLPPKILVVHRYTQKMVTNYNLFKIVPEVQIVMHMDGWGGGAKKKNTYQQFIVKEPVQFTGFKVFYKNDVLDPGTVLLTPSELLELSPKPIYIQYQ